ncbi:MAG: hypothetical protein EOP91_00120 [Lysobacteraceae bacterium]|nr:MAG: hypothetical protein EOP91_00120 [Xanthomonadaceae bacterium]
MKRAAFALILTAAMGSAFAQEAAPQAAVVVPAVAQATAAEATPAPAPKIKKAPKEDRMVNGTMVAAGVLGVAAAAAAISGGSDSDDRPSSP